MRKLLFLALLLTLVANGYAGGTKLIVPWFRVSGILNADSLAARALNLTGGITTATLTTTGKLVVGDSLRVIKTSILKGAVKIGAFTLPTAKGSAGQVLTDNGSGVVSWQSVGAGGWTDGGTSVYLSTLTDKVGIGRNDPSYPLDVYTASMAYNVQNVLRVRGNSITYPNTVLLGAYGMISNWEANYGSGDLSEHVVRIERGSAVPASVTGTLDSVNVLNVQADYMGFEMCRNTNYGFRFLVKNASSTGMQPVQSIFRIPIGGYFYVGDTTSGDKDWRMYVGDDAAWTTYLGWDDGNSEWNIESGNFTFNSGGGNFDWKLSSDNKANMFWMDASGDAVGINDASLAGTYDLEIGDSVSVGKAGVFGGEVRSVGLKSTLNAHTLRHNSNGYILTDNDTLSTRDYVRDYYASVKASPKAVKGANLQNFIYKAQARNRRLSPDSLKIFYFGDSILASADPVNDDSTWLEATFPGVALCVRNMAVGGNNWTQHHQPMLLDMLARENPDLIIFNEKPATGTESEVCAMMNGLRELRSRVTSDICMYTYHPQDVTTLGAKSGNGYAMMRRTGTAFDCEVVDTYQAFSDSIALAGGDTTVFLTDGLHLNERGQNVYHQEFISHLDTLTYFSSNYGSDMEEIVEFETPIFTGDTTIIRTFGTWTASAFSDATPLIQSYSVIENSTNADSVQVKFSGVGFDLYYKTASGGGDFEIYVDHAKPSTIKKDGFPLDYATATTPRQTNLATAWYGTIEDRALKVNVTDTTWLGQWHIDIYDSTNRRFKLYNPSADSVGEGCYDSLFVAGDITIPITYMGTANWIGTPYAQGYDLYFSVRRNWVDAVNTNATAAQKVARVFGLENKSHVLTIKHIDTDPISLDCIKFFRPKLGRK